LNKTDSKKAGINRKYLKTEKTKNRKTELLLKYAEIPQEIIQEKENGNF